MKFNINITEALCGFKKAVTTLDDRTLIIQTIPGKYPFITPVFPFIVARLEKFDNLEI